MEYAIITQYLLKVFLSNGSGRYGLLCLPHTTSVIMSRMRQKSGDHTCLRPSFTRTCSLSTRDCCFSRSRAILSNFVFSRFSFAPPSSLIFFCNCFTCNTSYARRYRPPSLLELTCENSGKGHHFRTSSVNPPKLGATT